MLGLEMVSARLYQSVVISTWSGDGCVTSPYVQSTVRGLMNVHYCSSRLIMMMIMIIINYSLATGLKQ